MVMKQCLSVAIFLLLLLHEAPCLAKQYALNVPAVLLPYVPASTGVKVNFTLFSPHGCFTWMSTKPDVVSVKGVPNGAESGCSRQALLTAQSTQPSRLNSIIIAEEQASGQTLRCDVFVDSIVRIEITTRTRELLLGEEPEQFEVQAFDEEGNMFSSVRGHVFEWSIFPDEEATTQQAQPESILNFIPFEESSYSTDPIIGQLELSGLQGDTVLVAGVNTGTAKVQVRLTDRAWQGVKPDIVKLLVIENIMLQPSMDVYILPLSFVDYRVERRKHGRSEVIAMPSEQYTLELTNTTVARLRSERSRVTGLAVGFTEVVLQDINMLHTPSATKPTAGVHVVPPHHISFSISPGNNWVLEVGRDYIITVNIFDKMNHKVHVTENVPLVTELPSLYLQSHFSSVNGSYHHVRALKRGVATLHSTLSKLKHPDTGELCDIPSPVTKHQPVEINDPVKLTPKQVVILWDPQTDYRYQHKMNVTGGSGSYQWSCDPVGVVGVSTMGMLTTIVRGKSLVTVTDTKNSAHFDDAEVFVVPPAEMMFLPSRVEALLGTNLSLPLQVKGRAGLTTPPSRDDLLPFQDCSRLQLEVQSSDPSLFNVTVHSQQNSQLPNGACTCLLATAVSPGHTKLRVTYRHEDIFLQAVVTIAAYPPLRPIDPEVIAVVTLGSSKNFVFEGGPAPWVLDQSKFEEKLVVTKEGTIATSHVTSTRGGVQQHVYRVVCRALGEESVGLSVGNGPTTRNRFPASETTTARISCALPVAMAMRPVIAQMPGCPLLSQTSSQNVQFPVRSGRPLNLEVTLYDSEDRSFDNFTSLKWNWGSSDQNALPTPQITSIEHKESRAIMTLAVGQQSGSVVLSASSNQYHPSHLRTEGVSPKPPFTPGINSSLSLLLRNEPSLTPQEVILFNHPQNKVALKISHGSGHFRIDHVAKGLLPASVTYIPEQGEISLTPVIEGTMKVSVYDLCLETDNVAMSTVVVAGVYMIEVQVMDKIQLGNSTLAFVRVLNNRQVPFPASQLRLMNLQANPRSPHITVTQASNQILSRLSHDQTSHSAVYEVTGVAVGTAQLVFNATATSGRVISSLPREIQVFDALQLSPKRVTLLPSATFQIRSSGGPVPHSSIVYSISNITVATVDDTGLIEAKTLGVAIVMGRAQATDASTGQLVTYSQDTVHLTVIRLTGVRLFVPSTRLLAGEEVAVYVEGVRDESPFSFASAQPGLMFHWSASNMDVLSLVSVYDKAGVSLQEEQDFTAMLRARNPGQGVVRVTVQCGSGLCEPDLATFTDRVQIRVLPPLELLRPRGGLFLLPQNGEARIVTNRDGVSSLSYRLLMSVGGESEGVIRVGGQGEISTAAVNGHAVVMVTANDEDMGLNQSVVVHVEVQPIASVSIIPLSLAQAQPNSKTHAFPLGYSAEFIVRLHDNIGRQFNYANIPLIHRLSSSHIVRVSPESGNNTYTVKAARQGDAIFKVWVTSQPHIADYVRVRVGYAILPSLATVHLGATVCFTTHLTEETNGAWSVGDGGVLQIEAVTGVGMAKSTGRAVVYHSSHDSVDTHTEITVSKVQKVTFGYSAMAVPTFTNAQRQSELGPYRVPIQFHHTGNEPFTPLHTSPNPACVNRTNSTGPRIQQVPFQCQLELWNTGSNVPLSASKFIATESTFEPRTGESYCTLGPTPDTYAAETLATVERASLVLQVRAFDSFHSYEVLSESLKVPFVPAFVLSRDQIRLGGGEDHADVTVTGLQQQLQALRVHVGSPHLISAMRTGTPSPTEATYHISLIDDPPHDHAHPIKVTFSTNLAQQESAITITLTPPISPDGACPDPDATVTNSATPEPTPPPRQSGYSKKFLPDKYTYPAVIVITLLAIVIATFVICVAVKQGSSQPQSGFAVHYPTSPPQAAFTPGSQAHTPHQQTLRYTHTPPVPGGSAFRRPNNYSPSPQHGLFSQ